MADERGEQDGEMGHHVWTRPGQPAPPFGPLVEMPNGKLVRASEFNPPQDLVGEELELWYENKEDELMFGDDE